MTTAEIINNMKTNISNAYDSVESRGGKLESKNFAKYTSPTQTINNVVFTHNEDDSMTVNGTPTGYIWFDLSSGVTLSAGTYTFAVKYSGIATGDDKAQVINATTDRIMKEIYTTAEHLQNTWRVITLTLTEETVCKVRYYFQTGATVNNQTIYFMLVSGEYTSSTMPDFEPYNKPKNLQNLSSAIESIDTPSNYLNFDLFNTSSNPKASSTLTKLKLDCSNRTTLANACGAYINLEELEFTNTDNITSVEAMCDGCSSLKKLVFGNADSLIICTYMYNNAHNLEEVYGFKNYGKGFTEQSAKYSKYKLSFSRSSKLTYDSLINIINNLYDLNLTYDVANGGTLYSQVIDFGTKNLAKLTEEEIAIATSKGWTLS